MEYAWHIENSDNQETSVRNSGRNLQGRNQGLIDELEAYMAPVSDGCSSYTQQGVSDLAPLRRIGGHQLPDSPPDSGSENPYSPTENHVPHAIAISLNEPYMLVQDHISHDILQQSGDYIYEELKPDSIDHGALNDVVVLQESNLDLSRTVLRHDIGLHDPTAYQNRFNTRVDLQEIDGQSMIINPQIVGVPHESLPPVYTNLQSEPSGKKRKLSQDVNSQVKCEPVLSPDSVSSLTVPRTIQAPPSVDGSEAGDDAPFQCIRFSQFQQTAWHSLFDQNFKPLPCVTYVVGADKGFNYSQIDEAFVCQKKNHFQVTCQIQMQGEPQYVKTNDGFKKIANFCLHFYGVKAEDPSQDVRVEQSQSDRTKKPFHPVPIEIRREGTKVTVGRLHFAETTNNNMRKKGRPNPDQRHFQLVVALRAYSPHGDYIVVAQASDRIIVRASNPGQFESDCTENWWQRGVSDNSVHFNGRVGINTDRPDESCVINGNLKVSGKIVYPSDARAKHNIEELDTAQQLRNVQSIRVVKFNYDSSFAEHSGLLGFDPTTSTPQTDTGVIAQEIRQVLPEAVKEAGDVRLPNGDTIQKFLVVNKDRIFMENLGAVKELCKVTGNLENRVNHLEKMNKKLCKISILQRRDSTRSSVSNDSRYSCASVTNSSKSFYSDGNISIEQIRDIARNIRRHEFCHKLSHNSPKYHRKQCKECKSHDNLKYHTNKPQENSQKPEQNNFEAQKYIDSLNCQNTSVLPEVKNNVYHTLSNKNDTRLWMRNSCEDEGNFNWGNTNLPFCCRKRDVYYNSVASADWISNKTLQVIIMILIFVMAVCLIVMSSLYFVNQKEVFSLREENKILRKNISTNCPHIPPYHKPVPLYGDSNRVKHLQTSHTNYNAAINKMEAKGIYRDYPTTLRPIIEKFVSTTTSTVPTPIPQRKTLIKKQDISEHKNFVQDQDDNRCSKQQYATYKEADPIGQMPRECSFGRLKIDLKDDVDIDCQDILFITKWILNQKSSCNLDPSQSYDQEPIESHPDKELNKTNQQIVENPQMPHIKSKQLNIPPERNASEISVMTKNDLQSQLQDDDNASTNSLKPHTNETELESTKKVKRSSSKRRFKRSSSEDLMYQGSDCSDEIEYTKVSFGIKSKTYTNDTMFTERICMPDFMNFTYHVPVSKCLKEKHIALTFRSPKIKELKICNYDNKICEVDNRVNCEKDIVPIESTGDVWILNTKLDCNMNRVLKFRAAFLQQRVQDLCLLPSDQKLGFVEYNIKLSRNCNA